MLSGWTRLRITLVALAVAAGAAACEGTVDQRVDDVRVAASLPPLERDPLLDAAADVKAAEMCAAGTAAATADPGERYDAETAAAVDELVAAAPLDPGTVDPGARNGDATNDIWSQWASDPTLVDSAWDDLGIGEVECADGDLYMATVLRDHPSMPPSGLYSAPQYTTAQVTQTAGLVYGTAVNHLGQTQSLLLDVFRPPASAVTARPTVVLVHGGGFSGGSRTDFSATAREYARRGFVAVSIDYRLQPNSTPAQQLQAAGNAIDDAMESVRWLKANAATYGIDTTRIAMLGSSAGGAIALGVGNWTDSSPGGPLAAWSPTVAAAVSTGAHLTPGLALVDWDATDAPGLLFHYETDTVTGNTDEYAFETCTAMRDAGNTCDFVTQPGSGHTTTLAAGGSWWASEIGPYLWTHLRLG